MYSCVSGLSLLIVESATPLSFAHTIHQVRKKKKGLTEYWYQKLEKGRSTRLLRGALLASLANTRVRWCCDKATEYRSKTRKQVLWRQCISLGNIEPGSTQTTKSRKKPAHTSMQTRTHACTQADRQPHILLLSFPHARVHMLTRARIHTHTADKRSQTWLLHTIKRILALTLS